MWVGIHESSSGAHGCGVSHTGGGRPRCMDRAPSLAPNEARLKLWSKRNGHDARVRRHYRVRSDKFHGKFEQGLSPQDLPDALCFGKAFRHKSWPWYGVKIPSQELVGRVTNTD